MHLQPPLSFASLAPLLGLLWGDPSSASPSADPDAPLERAQVVVGSISVDGNTRTRTHVIHRELLFASGDRLDTALVLETERNLRRFLFLGDVRVRMFGAAGHDSSSALDGTVDIAVEVEDLYARALSPLFAGEVGELNFGLVALDYNFLGRGQVLQVTGRHDAISGNSAGLLYREPRLWGSRLAAGAELELGDEGHRASLALAKPHYALASRWTYGASLRSSESIARLYSSTELSTSYRDRIDAGSIWLGHSAGDHIKVRPALRLSVSDRVFEAEHGFSYSPQDRKRVFTSASLIVWQPRYARTRFLRSLGRVEDVQIGSWIGAGVAFSQRALGSDRTFPSLSLQLSPRLRLHPNLFLFSTVSLRTRLEDRAYQYLITSTRIHVFLRLRTVHSLAVRTEFSTISRPEDASQYLLGLHRGLRGYAPRSFDGRRRFVLNVEARPTFRRTPDYVLAGSAFVDAGHAWDADENVALKAAVGLGLRLGLPRIYNTPILRCDVARGFASGGVWQLSFGIGQYF